MDRTKPVRIGGCGYRRAGAGGVTAAETGQTPERQGEGSSNIGSNSSGLSGTFRPSRRGALGACLIKKVVSGAVITKTAKRKVKLRREARTLKAKALCSLRRAVTAFNACDDDGRTPCVLLHMHHAAEMLAKRSSSQQTSPIHCVKSSASTRTRSACTRSCSASRSIRCSRTPPSRACGRR
jgi:hypothetical protein